MKDKVGQFAKGKFQYETPKLLIDVEQLEFEVECGKQYEGAIIISNSEGSYMKGLVISNDCNISLKEQAFTGESAVISFTFKATDRMKPGDEIQGYLSIVSSCGELELPYVARIQVPYIETYKGKLKDLFQFTNFAKEDWSEATKIFKSQQFSKTFLHNDPKSQALYQSFLKSVSTSQGLEEFLVSIHKKIAVTIEANNTHFYYAAVKESFQDKVVITKNQWGYEEYKVTSNVPFIVPEHKYLWTDNFLSNECSLSFLVDYDKMKAGMNEGIITIQSVHQTIVIQIEAVKVATFDYSINKKKKMTYEERLVNEYLQFRLQKITKEEYVEHVESILHNISVIEPSTMVQLYQTHVAIISGSEERAKKMISNFEDQRQELLKESVIHYCGYLYVKALFTKNEEDIRTAVEQIHEYYHSENQHWLLLWFICNLDKKYDQHKSYKIDEIKKQFDGGCTSPILYYEACVAYNDEPSLLKNLGRFEKQICHWGIKNQLLSDQLVKQFVYFANRLKQYESLTFRDLVYLYEQKEDEEILSIICRMLIKGQKTNGQYFPWFERGVKAGLKITELHEYYMYTIDEEENLLLPQPILLYYLYNSSLSDQKKAYFYSSIIRHKEDNMGIYRMYLKQMESFAKRQIGKGAISKTLAIIYDDVLTEDLLDETLAKELPNVLFRYELCCDNHNMIGAVVKYKELEEEIIVPLVDGKAQFNLYNDEANIFLIDEHQNRYHTTIGYTINQLFHGERFITCCYEVNSTHPLLLLYLADDTKMENHNERISVHVANELLKLDTLTPSYRGKIQIQLMEFYHSHKDYELLEECLKELDFNLICGYQIHNLIEYMIELDLYAQAFEVIHQFGYEQVDVERLCAMCQHLLSNQIAVSDKAVFIKICDYVFKKEKADNTILQGLVEQYVGTTKEQLNIWEKAKQQNMDTSLLEDRLLGQMLFSESEMIHSYPIFYSYYPKCKDKVLIRGYLSYYGYKYLMNDRAVKDELFKIMRKESFYEYNQICLLALLKYYSQKDNLGQDEIEFVDVNVNEFIEQGIILPYFQKFKRWIQLPQSIVDKVYVEYVTNPANQVIIHYSIGNQEEFIDERINPVYEGIFVKEFVLFYNESLQYYITEEGKEGSHITTSHTLTVDVSVRGNNRYDELNQILISREQKDQSQLIQQMQDYVTKDYVTKTLFQPL